MEQEGKSVSGIYISDMEMPKTCNGCAFNLIGHCMAYKGLYVERKNLEYNGKPEWCPLVELPPHGRLIDADALMETIRAHDYPLKAHFNSTDNGMFTIGIQQAVDEQPTIIDAEVRT